MRFPHRRAPLERAAASATAAPAPAPCFRRRRRPPSQLFESSDGAQTVAAFRVIAIKKQPYTLCKAVFRSGNTSTPGTFCSLSHSPGTLPRANQQSAGLILPARLCRAIVPRHDAKTNAARWFQNTRPRTAATIGATSSERATKSKAPTAGHAALCPRHVLLSFPFPGDSPAG